MLTKQYSTLETAKATNKNSSLPLVIKVTSQDELNQAFQIHQARTGLRGLSLPSSLLKELKEPSKQLKDSKANYFEITLEEQKHLNLIKEHCHSKNTFIQITIPLIIFKTTLLKQLQHSCNRLIIDFKQNQNSIQITKQEINHIFAELIAHKFYPFTKNIPQNIQSLVAPQFRVEYFQCSLNSKIIENKDALVFMMEKQDGDLL